MFLLCRFVAFVFFGVGSWELGVGGEILGVVRMRVCVLGGVTL